MIRLKVQFQSIQIIHYNSDDENTFDHIHR